MNDERVRLDKPPTDPLTPAAASELLGVTATQVYRLRDQGKLPCWQSGRTILFSQRAVLAYKAKRNHRK